MSSGRSEKSEIRKRNDESSPNDEIRSGFRRDILISDLVRHSGFGFRVSATAPFAGTGTVVHRRRMMTRIDWAVFRGVFGFVMAGAPASVDDGVAIELL
jgi:hypothetical protein